MITLGRPGKNPSTPNASASPGALSPMLRARLPAALPSQQDGWGQACISVYESLFAKQGSAFCGWLEWHQNTPSREPGVSYTDTSG